jgi:hypothetical protein
MLTNSSPYSIDNERPQHPDQFIGPTLAMKHPPELPLLTCTLLYSLSPSMR